MANNNATKGKDALAGDYGYALAVINSDPDLRELFNQAWAAKKDKKVGDWSSALFVSKLRKTDWFKSRTAAQRQYYIDSNDPAQKKTFEAQLLAGRTSVESIAKRSGALLSESQIASLAKESKLNGWTELQLTNAINTHIQYKSDPSTGIKSLFGQAGTSETELRSFARSMGVSVTDNWVLKQAKAAASTGDTKFAQDWIRARAKEKYAPYANELDSSNLEDLSYNYRKSMADHLELDVDEIKVEDPTIAKFMSTPNADGQKQSLWEFDKQIRKDPRWSKTKNAKESANSTVNSILSSFGLM